MWTAVVQGRSPALSCSRSRQAAVVASRTVLETQVRGILRDHPEEPVSPGRSAGAASGCWPSRVEFWQESPDGLHDRSATPAKAAA